MSEGDAVATPRPLDEELRQYRLGVVDVFVHDWAEGTKLYTTAGETDDTEKIADHEGAIILDGHFYEVIDDGTITLYHPHAGYCDYLDRNGETDEPAVLLSEVKAVA